MHKKPSKTRAEYSSTTSLWFCRCRRRRSHCHCRRCCRRPHFRSRTCYRFGSINLFLSTPFSTVGEEKHLNNWQFQHAINAIQVHRLGLKSEEKLNRISWQCWPALLLDRKFPLANNRLDFSDAFMYTNIILNDSSCPWVALLKRTFRIE